jgi:hypothetical protein
MHLSTASELISMASAADERDAYFRERASDAEVA